MGKILEALVEPFVACERVADLVRHWRPHAALPLLGGAAFVGWLLARQNPDVALSDVTPTA